MREIKFRAKCNGEWKYGLLIKTNEGDLFGVPSENNPYVVNFVPTDRPYCIQADTKFDEEYDVFPVDEDTVGQFTGLIDRNGKEIYEGDIIKCENVVYEIAFDKGAFCWKDTIGSYYVFADNYYPIEVIGNIHDNPELMKGGDDEEG